MSLTRLTVSLKFCSSLRAVHRLKTRVILGCLAAGNQQNEAGTGQQHTETNIQCQCSTNTNITLNRKLSTTKTPIINSPARKM